MSKNQVIVTITRNSSHIWRYFVDSFKDYCSEYSLFVWDNGSRDGDKEYLATYVEDGVIAYFHDADANYLFTHATNCLIETAFRNSNVEQVIVANPDIVFIEGWDTDVQGNEGIMGFVLVKPNGIIEHAGGFGGGDHLGRGEEDTGQYQELRDVDWVTFGTVAISRRAFEVLGKLQQGFPHFGSDREYCALAKTKGIPVKCSGKRLIHSYGKSTRPYEWRDIPDNIWKQHVEERKRSGVFFPDDQNRIPRIDSPGKYT